MGLMFTFMGGLIVYMILPKFQIKLIRYENRPLNSKRWVALDTDNKLVVVEKDGSNVAVKRRDRQPESLNPNILKDRLCHPYIGDSKVFTRNLIILKTMIKMREEFKTGALYSNTIYILIGDNNG